LDHYFGPVRQVTEWCLAREDIHGYSVAIAGVMFRVTLDWPNGYRTCQQINVFDPQHPGAVAGAIDHCLVVMEAQAQRVFRNQAKPGAAWS
jgi:hypothetical protein